MVQNGFFISYEKHTQKKNTKRDSMHVDTLLFSYYLQQRTHTKKREICVLRDYWIMKAII